MAFSRTLSIEVVGAGRNHPRVRLLLDGEDTLGSGRAPHGPAAMLDSGALLPTDPPRRVGFYGCTCGDFGCSCVSAVVALAGHQVWWTDFRTVTGVFDQPLADEEFYGNPDPAFSTTGHVSSRSLGLPDLFFDAGQYLATVRAAMADRSWESRPAAIVRLLGERRPALAVQASYQGDAVEIFDRTPGRWDWAVCLLPREGSAEELTESLTRLLDSGIDLPDIWPHLWAVR